MLSVNRFWRCGGAAVRNICTRTAASVVTAADEAHAGVVLPVRFGSDPKNDPLSEYVTLTKPGRLASPVWMAPFDAFSRSVRIASGVAPTAPSRPPSRADARRFWSSKNVKPNCSMPKINMASTPMINANSTAAAPSSRSSLWRILIAPLPSSSGPSVSRHPRPRY